MKEIRLPSNALNKTELYFELIIWFGQDIVINWKVIQRVFSVIRFSSHPTLAPTCYGQGTRPFVSLKRLFGMLWSLHTVFTIGRTDMFSLIMTETCVWNGQIMCIQLQAFFYGKRDSFKHVYSTRFGDSVNNLVLMKHSGPTRLESYPNGNQKIKDKLVIGPPCLYPILTFLSFP